MQLAEDGGVDGFARLDAAAGQDGVVMAGTKTAGRTSWALAVAHAQITLHEQDGPGAKDNGDGTGTSHLAILS